MISTDLQNVRNDKVVREPHSRRRAEGTLWHKIFGGARQAIEPSLPVSAEISDASKKQEWNLIRKINRRLPEYQKLHKTRGEKWKSTLGNYYIVDHYHDSIIDTHVDIDEYRTRQNLSIRNIPLALRNTSLDPHDCLEHAVVFLKSNLPDDWKLAMAECSVRENEPFLHCWLENDEMVANLTAKPRFYTRKKFYDRFTPRLAKYYTRLEAAIKGLEHKRLIFWDFDLSKYYCREYLERIGLNNKT